MYTQLCGLPQDMVAIFSVKNKEIGNILLGKKNLIWSSSERESEAKNHSQSYSWGFKIPSLPADDHIIYGITEKRDRDKRGKA